MTEEDFTCAGWWPNSTSDAEVDYRIVREFVHAESPPKRAACARAGTCQLVPPRAQSIKYQERKQHFPLVFIDNLHQNLTALSRR